MVIKGHSVVPRRYQSNAELHKNVVLYAICFILHCASIVKTVYLNITSAQVTGSHVFICNIGSREKLLIM